MEARERGKTVQKSTDFIVRARFFAFFMPPRHSSALPPQNKVARLWHPHGAYPTFPQRQYCATAAWWRGRAGKHRILNYWPPRFRTSPHGNIPLFLAGPCSSCPSARSTRRACRQCGASRRLASWPTSAGLVRVSASSTNSATPTSRRTRRGLAWGRCRRCTLA